MTEKSPTEDRGSEPCVLDHVDNITLDEAHKVRFEFEVDTIRYLTEGLRFLAGAISRTEVQLRERGCHSRNSKELWHGQDEELQDVPYGLVVCCFHWYAVSACNMARLIGWIARSLDETRPTPADYLQKVLPRIRTFRDKIAAHFAGAMEHRFDSPAERRLSVLPPIDYQRGYFVATPNVLIRAEAETLETSSSDAVLPWSLTVAHLQLGKRYWGVPPEYEGKEFGAS